MSEKAQFKFVVIGASGVGKTSILRRLVEGKFVPGTQSTVGVEYFTYNTKIEGNQTKMMIWDTAGQERFYSISKAYFRGALGIVLVFDITERRSFDQLPRWLRDARADADPHCVVILVGNKCDLSANRTVSLQEAEDFAKTNKLSYIETSAQDNTNIEEVFQRTGSELMRKYLSGELVLSNSYQQRGPPSVRTKKTPEKEESSCC